MASNQYYYDPVREVVVDTTTGDVVYHETGTGEIDIRKVVRGEVTWEDGKPFTLDDFFTEALFRRMKI